MNILSAVSTHHDESVCVLKNNEIKYHLQLERYTRRKKNKYIKYIVNPFDTDEDGVFQGMYQNRVLEKLDPAVNKIINLNYSRLLIKLSSIIDKIDIFATSTVFQKRSLQQMDELNKLDKNIIYPIFESKKFDVDIDSIENSRYLFCSPPKKLNDFHLLQDKIYLIDHHQSHAAYALYTSNFEEADVFAYDGWGSNFQSAFVNANGDMFELGFLSKNPEVYTGFLWSNVSLFLFANNMKEGTMMGLSAYGKIDDKLLKLFKEPLDSDDEKLKANVCATLQHFTVETVVNALKKRKT
ncbi:hypothetical protein EB155_01830, partial [archaeon]|nr:hypothetical protein [archaeon]